MRKRSLKLQSQAQYVSLVLPGMILFSVGVIIPMFMGLRYSFTSWDGFTKNLPWNGLDNYIKILHDPDVLNAWWFTIKFTFWNTIIQNVFALLLAVAIDGAIKGKKLYRTIFFIPCLISPVVAGFIWMRLYGTVLPALNDILKTNINFMLFGSGSTVLKGFLIANNWQWIGYWMLIYIAALQSIPGDLYEAARVDGASPILQFFKITIPMLAPAFTICIVGITVGSLKVYDLLVASTGGGPGRASNSIIYLTYNNAINDRQYGYGSAMSTSLIVVLLIVAAVQISWLRKKEVQI
jgi:ABC-type sugar transport system permease subunit